MKDPQACQVNVEGFIKMPEELIWSKVDRARETIKQINGLRDQIIALTKERIDLIADMSSWDPIRDHVETSLQELQEHSKDVNATLEQATVDGLEWYIHNYEKAQSIVMEGDGPDL